MHRKTLKSCVQSLSLAILDFTSVSSVIQTERVHMGLGWQLNHLTCEQLPMKQKSSLLGRRGRLGSNPWEWETRILIFHLLQGRQQQVKGLQISAELTGEGKALS